MLKSVTEFLQYACIFFYYSFLIMSKEAFHKMSTSKIFQANAKKKF